LRGREIDVTCCKQKTYVTSVGKPHAESFLARDLLHKKFLDFLDFFLAMADSICIIEKRREEKRKGKTMEYEAVTDEEALATLVYRTAFEYGRDGRSLEELLAFCEEQGATEGQTENAPYYYEDGKLFG